MQLSSQQWQISKNLSQLACTLVVWQNTSTKNHEFKVWDSNQTVPNHSNHQININFEGESRNIPWLNEFEIGENIGFGGNMWIHRAWACENPEFVCPKACESEWWCDFCDFGKGKSSGRSEVGVWMRKKEGTHLIRVFGYKQRPHKVNGDRRLYG